MSARRQNKAAAWRYQRLEQTLVIGEVSVPSMSSQRDNFQMSCILVGGFWETEQAKEVRDRPFFYLTSTMSNQT